MASRSVPYYHSILKHDQVKLCAQAMGIEVFESKTASSNQPIPSHHCWWAKDQTGRQFEIYDPLHDDAQAFALIKRFNLSISKLGESPYCVWPNGLFQEGSGSSPDLNAAIVECVAYQEHTRQQKRKADAAQQAA